MIIRKVREIDPQGKIIYESRIDLDANKVKIYQSKRAEASKKIEIINLPLNSLFKCMLLLLMEQI